VSWDNATDRVALGPELLKEMEDHMVKIKQNLKATQDRQKSYADKNRTNREFKVGEHVLLKVNPKKISLRLGSCIELVARFYCPFEIFDRIGLVAYILTLSASMNVHNVFHLYLLKKYVHDPNHVIDWNFIQVEPKETFRSNWCAYWTKKSKCSRIKS
jgi:hypothetical protein